ncbi:4a-hydroxytetrahydrobiopterin dehydratase [Deinococcus arcticus]|uniref:4a-hydroxytetrahydrobiopterin dehydratase n=2 Tax=Deinococcus arcticus TaxID=2136176 RepID=A0A2T3W458_9DEIO|nr:4a-hydroxytetrahydrobiopterin dehydratase [Deinococcus arcticus]
MNYDPTRKLTDGDVMDLKPEGWYGDAGKLFRDFTFPDFRTGMAFAVRVAEQAEARGHHPDIHVHYHNVRVNFFTYDAGGVTRQDIDAAYAVNGLAQEEA